jgi:exodeoxyribonuclease VII small subunit
MAEMRFEEGLKKLEKIVNDLEDGSLSLDDALEKYEEGIRLSKACAKKLEAARKKVEILLKSEDGSVELKEFDEKMADEAFAAPAAPDLAEAPGTAFAAGPAFPADDRAAAFPSAAGCRPIHEHPAPARRDAARANTARRHVAGLRPDLIALLIIS